MIGERPDSIASQLHYPPKELAARSGAAIAFYCEVLANGKAHHLTVVAAREKSAFQSAVEKAVLRGRFIPASVNGKPVPVLLSGTVFFVSTSARPAMAITLVTADKAKVAALGNYIQPQLIGGHEAFVRKLYDVNLRTGSSVNLLKDAQDVDVFALYHVNVLHAAVQPNAEVMVQVDASGNVTGTKLLRESPTDMGYGEMLRKTLQSAKFIPAFASGKAVSGEFNLPFNFLDARNPDAPPRTGTLLRHR